MPIIYLNPCSSDSGIHQGCADLPLFIANPNFDMPVIFAELAMCNCVENCKKFGQKYAAVSKEYSKYYIKCKPTLLA